MADQVQRALERRYAVDGRKCVVSKAMLLRNSSRTGADTGGASVVDTDAKRVSSRRPITFPGATANNILP